MSVAKGFLIIILSGIVFALGGGVIGYTLAVFLPSYYRGVFSSGRESWFDPMEVGIGLGATQGLMCGLVVGGVVVLAVAWYNSRRGFPDVRFTATTQDELQRHLAEHVANPGEAISREQIKAETLARFRK